MTGQGAPVPRDECAQHWTAAYAEGDTTRSWYQRTPTTSLRMFEAAGITTAASVIDVGGGASRLSDALLRLGYADLTVLDIAADGMAIAQQRLGDGAARISWLTQDLRSWKPERRYDVWHDRALLHFFTTSDEQADYIRVLHEATHPGSTTVIATFAPDGPGQCSGLPVIQRDAPGIAALLGAQWQVVTEEREEHRTPDGGVQPFTWTVLRRRSASATDQQSREFSQRHHHH